MKAKGRPPPVQPQGGGRRLTCDALMPAAAGPSMSLVAEPGPSTPKGHVVRVATAALRWELASDEKVLWVKQALGLVGARPRIVKSRQLISKSGPPLP